MSFRQIKEAKNIVTFIGAIQYLISNPNPKGLDRAQDMAKEILDLFENDTIGFEFVENGEIIFESSRLCVIFPINWYEKGGNSFVDAMKVFYIIAQWFNHIQRPNFVSVCN
jgi:hypothetical protein